MLRDAVLVAAVAVVAFQALRRWGGDYYRVPSGSMEPVLHGEPQHGDIVFVAKFASAAACRRHDLVVVAHPQEPRQQMVKRIAARGDDPEACCIDIRDGDVWLGPDRQRLQREQKDPLESRSLRVPWTAWPARAPHDVPLLELRHARVVGTTLALPSVAGRGDELRGLLLPEARAERRRDIERGTLPTGFVGTARPVDASYTRPNGERSREGDDAPVVDCGMDLQVTAPVDELLCTVEIRNEALTFHWQPPTGRVTLWRDGVDVETKMLPVFSGAHRIEFGRLDGRMFFVVDGRRDALFLVGRQPGWQGPEGGSMVPVGPRSHLHFAPAGARELQLASIEVFRDVHAHRERILGMPGMPSDWPRFVEPGHWFLLGDNTFDSRDSRSFGAVPASSFLGSPWFVLGPWPRTRWLQQ
jgi:hypothetical protein